MIDTVSISDSQLRGQVKNSNDSVVMAESFAKCTILVAKETLVLFDHNLRVPTLVDALNVVDFFQKTHSKVLDDGIPPVDVKSHSAARELIDDLELRDASWRRAHKLLVELLLFVDSSSQKPSERRVTLVDQLNLVDEHVSWTYREFDDYVELQGETRGRKYLDTRR